MSNFDERWKNAAAVELRAWVQTQKALTEYHVGGIKIVGWECPVCNAGVNPREAVCPRCPGYPWLWEDREEEDCEE